VFPPAGSLEHLRRTQEELLYQLTTDAGQEYGRGGEQVDHEPDQWRRELVRRLLVKAYVSREEVGLLGYELDAWHLGVIATGAKATQALEEVRRSLGCELLLISQGWGSWAWFGGARQIQAAELKRALSRSRQREVSFAIGEAGPEVHGWRLTHHQARDAHRVAVYRPQRLTWYADNPLLAAALRDETLAGSLRQKYLTPLRSQKDGGAALRKTLRAYIDADFSPTSAAPVVKVRRHTVADRVRLAEQLMDRTVRACVAELDVALRLEELEEHRSRRSGGRPSG
jgi:hypothetical protein